MIVSTGCMSEDDSPQESLFSESTAHFIKRFWYQQQTHQCGSSVSDGWEIGADIRERNCFPAVAPAESYPHKYLQVSYWMRTSAASNPNDDATIGYLTVYVPGGAVAQRPVRVSDFEGTGWQEIRQNVDMSGREGATITPTVYFTEFSNRQEQLFIGMMDIYWREKHQENPISGGPIPQ